ncbi:RNA-directed DNA polymerase, eukaryota, reverse transcriptase zinc-binding domain protein, partial [Tanacetum coccineum]
MYIIASWNIRGLNGTPKQTEVRQVINENCLNVCVILESHVDIGKLENVCARVCAKWKWASNGSYCTKGSRIILGWNDDIVDVNVLSCFSQVIHSKVILKSDQKALFCTFVYASNSYVTRRQLWQNLKFHKHFVHKALGDLSIEVDDVNSTGLQFTWNQKPRAERGILKKIDRVMGNVEFSSEYL